VLLWEQPSSILSLPDIFGWSWKGKDYQMWYS